MKPQFMIAAPVSGSGKTTFTLGLLHALHKRGVKVQPFKCGADYIDIQYHTIVSERESVNLDLGLASRTHIQYIYNKYGEHADVCITEGVMGLYDGYRRMQGSCAEIAKILNIPVILIVNARATAYSVAPLLYGFRHFNPSVRIAGVVFNQTVSPAHFAMLKEACSDAGIECLGHLPSIEDINLPSRHQSITSVEKQSIVSVSSRVAEQIEKHVDIDKMLNLCTRIFPCRYTLPYTSEIGIEAMHYSQGKRMQIAIARDPAFCFLYRENIDRLAELGKITYFSPVYGSDLPEADLVYLPGGYPEFFARQLHRRKRLMQQLRDYAEKGGKLLAECGGMVLLSRSLTVRKGGTAYAMANVLPFECTSADSRLTTGYRRMNYRNMEWKGHEFHYSTVLNPDALPTEAPLYTPAGTEVGTPIYRYKNVIAGFTHWYWGETDVMKFWE